MASDGPKTSRMSGYPMTERPHLRPSVRRVSVSHAPIDPDRLVKEVVGPTSGAVALFLGTVRDHSPGKQGITHLEYEAYERHIVAKIDKVVDQAIERRPINAVVVEHRLGKVDLEGIAVAVAVACAHRDDAFVAARYIIDELKKQAPIWKKEVWEDGEAWSTGS